VTARAEPLPQPFRYLWAATVVNHAGSFVILFLVPYLTLERGLSPGAAGAVVGAAYGLGGIAGTLTGGVLADRWGRRSTMVSAHLVNAAAAVGLGLASAVPLTVLSAVVVGAASNAVRPATSAVAVDLTTEPQRQRAFTLLSWANNLGFATASVLGASVLSSGLIGYSGLFLLDAVTTVAAAAAVALRVPETRPEPAAADLEPGRTRAPGLGVALRDRRLLAVVGLTVLYAAVFLQHISTMPVALVGDGLPLSTYGWLIGLNAALIVGGQPLVPRLTRDRDPGRALALAAALMGGGFGLLAVLGGTGGYIASVVVWTLGEMLYVCVAPAVVAGLSPPGLRGRYQGLYANAFPAAALVGPAVGGWALSAAGADVLWVGCLVVGLLCAAGHLAAGAARRRPEPVSNSTRREHRWTTPPSGSR
jgi:MFS family permease